MLSLSGVLPHLCIFLCFPFFSYSNPHSFITTSYNLIYSYFPSLVVCLHMQYSTRWTSLFPSFIPCQMINHLTAMCQPHGFMVTDYDCLQPIASFVGFRICPLLETKHGLCQEHCPIYMFFFIFLSFSCLNPHSFITTVMTLFISIFHSLTACLRIQYSTH
jgi:hypothetical protein